MKWMHWFFREWMRRCIQRFACLAILGPLLAFVLHAGEERIDSFAEWAWGLLALLLPIILRRWLWNLLLDHTEEKAAPPTPAKLRQAELEAVADSVDELPQGVSLAELCEQLDDKQTRRLLHLLHQTPPGERHLRDMLPKL